MPEPAAACGCLPGVGEIAPGTSEQAPAPTPTVLKPSPTSSPVPGLGRQLCFPTEPQSWVPSLSLLTRQEEDFFSHGEGPAVLVPRDFRARVSVDLAWEGDTAVEDGGDLLQVQTRNSWWDCPRGHQDKERHMTTRTSRERTATE